jgi:hypothetical protein
VRVACVHGDFATRCNALHGARLAAASCSGREVVPAVLRMCVAARLAATLASASPRDGAAITTTTVTSGVAR